MLLLPFILVMAQLAAWYAWRPLRPGETAVLTASRTSPETRQPGAPVLEAPEGLAVDAGPVRVPRLGEVSWRVRGVHPGAYHVRLTDSDSAVSKEVVVADDLRPVSPRRVARRPLAALLYPREPVLPGRIYDRIDLAYPERELLLGPWRVNWLVAFFVLTLFFALLSRAPMRVEL